MFPELAVSCSQSEFHEDVLDEFEPTFPELGYCRLMRSAALMEFTNWYGDRHRDLSGLDKRMT